MSKHRDDCYGKVGLSACRCCNCATFGNAHSCPIHTQADFEAPVSAGAETEPRTANDLRDSVAEILADPDHPQCQEAGSVNEANCIVEGLFHRGWYLNPPVGAQGEPPQALDAARAEIQANRAQGVKWDPPVSSEMTRWYAEGYDRGLRDADTILARLSKPCPRPRHDEHGGDGDE